jgi:hypothetical protein
MSAPDSITLNKTDHPPSSQFAHARIRYAISDGIHMVSILLKNEGLVKSVDAT